MAERIFATGKEVEVTYRSSPPELGEPQVATDLAGWTAATTAALQARSGEEIRSRRALIGPQRDELSIRLAGRDAGSFASAGEQRRAAFVLTMAAAELAAESSERPTLVLMDDVEAEFDDERLDRVLGFLGNAVQTLVATSKRNVAERYAPLGRVLEVEAGRIRA